MAFDACSARHEELSASQSQRIRLEAARREWDLTSHVEEVPRSHELADAVRPVIRHGAQIASNLENARVAARTSLAAGGYRLHERKGRCTAGLQLKHRDPIRTRIIGAREHERAALGLALLAGQRQSAPEERNDESAGGLGGEE